MYISGGSALEYSFLVCAMLLSASLSIMSSLFGKRNPSVKNSSLLYSVFVTGAAAFTWGVICVCNAEFSLDILGYSVLYALFYTLAMLGMFKAYQTGPTSLTAFIKQLSLIFVAIWGFVFWSNPITANITIGLVLIVAALHFCFGIKAKGATENSVSMKWFLYAAMLLVGNAGCSIVQKYQNMAHQGKNSNIFMLFAVFISFLVCIALYAGRDRCKLSHIKKGSAIFPIVGGISSGLLNLFILLLISSPMSEGIIFPGIAVGGLIITILFSTLVYREKPTVFQWIGLGVGAVALVFLNL